MRTVFFGTPEFAVPTLAALVEADLAPVVVVSQPDRPVGRGRKVRSPPVVRWAVERGLRVEQPERVRSKALRTLLEELAPDVAVVVAYGQIFPKSLLELPRLGCVNLHGSLLPRWRGAAPVQAAIAAGDRTTGVTTMQMEAGLDTGPILLAEETPIGPDETTPDVAERLSILGADLMVETLGRLDDGSIEARGQDPSRATHAPLLERSDGEIDWSMTAQQIYDRWRAFQPWPGLATRLGGEPLKVREVRLLEGTAPEGSRSGRLLEPMEVETGAEPSRVVPAVCGDGTILGLLTLQRPGRRSVPAADLFHGEEHSGGVLAG